MKGKGFKLTGQLGEVMNESASLAYSYVKKLLQNELEIESKKTNFQQKFEEQSTTLEMYQNLTGKLFDFYGSIKYQLENIKDSSIIMEVPVFQLGNDNFNIKPSTYLNLSFC